MVKQLFARQNIRAGDYENGAFDPASGFQFPDEGQSIYSDEYGQLDELELIKVAREELRQGAKSFKREEKEEMAKDMLGYEHHERLREVLRYVCRFRVVFLVCFGVLMCFLDGAGSSPVVCIGWRLSTAT